MSIKEKTGENSKGVRRTLNEEERASALSVGDSIRTGMCKVWTGAGAQRAPWKVGSHLMLTAASVTTTQAGSGSKSLFMVLVPAGAGWVFPVNVQRAAMATGPPLDTQK